MPNIRNLRPSFLIIPQLGQASVKLPPFAVVSVNAMSDEIRSTERKGLISIESLIKPKAKAQPSQKPEPEPHVEVPRPEVEEGDMFGMFDDTTMDGKIAEMIKEGKSQRAISEALDVPKSRIRKVLDQGQEQ